MEACALNPDLKMLPAGDKVRILTISIKSRVMGQGEKILIRVRSAVYGLGLENFP